MILLNGKQIEPTNFSDGTSQVWHLDNDDYDFFENAFIEWNFKHEGEIIYLAQLVDLLRHDNPEIKLCLHMEYLPYARQDKPVSNDTSFALTSFAKIINSMNFCEVTTLDAHSDAPKFLINNFESFFPYTAIDDIIRELNPDVICFPDKGARDRYNKGLARYGRIHLFGEKVRDQQTGHILSYDVQAGELVKDCNVLMVDDICDGGTTFVLLAEKLLTLGANSANLYCTHGIFSKGLKPLRNAGISRIFTKDGEVGEIGGAIAFNVKAV